MSAVNVASGGPATGTDDRPGRYPWWLILVMFLVPGVLSTAFAALLAPVLREHGLPGHLALDLSPVVLVGELGLLLALGRRRNGRLSLRGVVGFRQRLPLPRLLGVLAGLYLAMLALYLLMRPLTENLATHVFGWVPDWLGGEPAHEPGRAGLVLLVVGTAVFNTVVDPIIEEMYFRGHLLPRMPIAGFAAVVVNAALFSVQHFWQPELYLFVFGCQVLLMTALVRFGDLRISMAGHCLVNGTGAVLTLLAYAHA
ncbi:CPBP family intramembrane glutamic endopeptidase [Actinoplanes sp. NPDC023801]|uniref:CPBP family intramembrane glutamic endopeptidase n=1 Tax=Actinoplanes sp. NPDC023801 TaxID=3154595 RepID=UPI0033EEF1BD